MTEPNYTGTYNDELTFEHTMVGTSDDVTVASGLLNVIRRINVETSSTSWRLKIYDRSARAAANLAYDSGLQSGDFIEITAGLTIRDKDGNGNLYFTIEGGIGEDFDFTFDISRFS